MQQNINTYVGKCKHLCRKYINIYVEKYITRMTKKINTYVEKYKHLCRKI